MNIEYIKQNSAIWIEETNSSKAFLIVKFQEFQDEQLFTAWDEDIETHSRDLITMLLNGEGGSVKSFQDYTVEQEAQQEAQVREENLQRIEEISVLDPTATIPVESSYTDLYTFEAALIALLDSLKT